MNEANPTEAAVALEAVLTELTAVHQELLELVREHRQAIARSDAAAIQECLSRQGMLAYQGGQLEARRLSIVQSFGGRARMTVGEIAASLPENWRGSIAAQSDRLRAVLMEIQRENGVVRAATQSLMGHIDGLMQQVSRALSRAGTYGRAGRVDGGPVACGLDMVH